jgi:hypothetical protein
MALTGYGELVGIDGHPRQLVELSDTDVQREDIAIYIARKWLVPVVGEMPSPTIELPQKPVEVKCSHGFEPTKCDYCLSEATHGTVEAPSDVLDAYTQADEEKTEAQRATWSPQIGETPAPREVQEFKPRKRKGSNQ